MKKYGLVNERRFVAATRDTGYRSTTAAVSELVDNAIQAQARHLAISIHENRDEDGRKVTLSVADDGVGMTPSELQRALQWAGSTRFNDRSGLGRFGMGLPNSSVSQARRVEVYTWRNGRRPYFSYLDVDEIERGELLEVPRPTRRRLPSWAPRSGSGTLVIWSKCDRLDYRKASTLERRLKGDLGRIFREAIWNGVGIAVNGGDVMAIDPLFINPPPNNPDDARAVEPVPPLRFPIRTEGGIVSEVVVRFALLPIEEWHDLPAELKRSLGIVGGAGVSILRAGREIAHGWFFMDGKRRQNYDDWWRLQVEFSPPLDELMGVTHSKQGIRPTQEINNILGPEIGEVARQLSAQVRQEFVRLAKVDSEAASRAGRREWRLPRVPIQPRGAPSSRPPKMEHLQYELLFADSAEPEFFSWSMDGSQVQLYINENHPFYRTLYRPVAEAGLDWVKSRIDLMLLAYARAEIGADSTRRDGSLRAHWSDVVATFLGE